MYDDKQQNNKLTQLKIGSEACEGNRVEDFLEDIKIFTTRYNIIEIF